MSEFENPIDEILRTAMQDGAFDDLPGAGRPLRLDDNPHEHPDWRLANHVLKNSGFLPQWLETRKEIEQEIEVARADLLRPRRTGGAAGDRQRAAEAFRQRVIEINRKIRTYNLQAPSVSLHLPPLDAQREIDEADQL